MSAKAPMTNAAEGPRVGKPAARPVATPRRELHMVGNAHLDAVWLWPWQEGYQEARATFWSAIQRMDEYPDFVFTCNQTVLLSYVEESDPELFERIKERVAEGRWVNTGGWWVEPDCNLPMGESFARQGLLGQRYLQSRFGRPATAGMNVDPFGHNVMIPQILQLQGMDSYCFLRPGPHESRLNESAFWWESPDGSRVLAWRIPFEYCSPPGSVAGQAEKSLGQINESEGTHMIFYGVGNHGGGPTKANIESIQRMDTMGSFGEMVLSSPPRFFAALQEELGEDGLAALPVWRDELQQHAAGCYSAHSGIKAWQRRAQMNVLNAERWLAVTGYTHGIEYPREDMTRAWKDVAFNQFHDTMPGSAIEPAYDDARDQLGEAVAIAKRSITRAHNVLAREVQVDVEDGTQPILVFNPHPWPLSTDIEMQYGGQPTGVHVVDADGVHTPSQMIQSTATTDDTGRGAVAFRADVPALGYRLYRLRSGPQPGADRDSGPVRASSTLLENQHLRAEFDPHTGWLSSLLVKDSGVDVIKGAEGEHIQISQDPTDTWGHRVISYAGEGTAMRTVRMVLREQGPLRARLVVERQWNRSTLIEEFILSDDSKHLEVRVTLDWREEAHLMKMRFPVNLVDPIATYEVPYAVLQRPVDGGEEPGQSWADLSGILGGPSKSGLEGGLAIANNTKQAYDASPANAPVDGWSPSLGITAVRSPVYSWHDPRLLDPEGFYSYQDQGIQKFTYLMIPHEGSWRNADPVRRGAEVTLRARAQLESFHDGSRPTSECFFQVADARGPGDVIVSAIKGSEDPGVGGGTDLIVRAYESSGAPGVTTVTLDAKVSGRKIRAEFGPHQVRTFKIPADSSLPISEVDLVEWEIGGRARGTFFEIGGSTEETGDSESTAVDVEARVPERNAK